MPCYGPSLYTSNTDVCGCIMGYGFYFPLGPTPPPYFFTFQGIYGQRFGIMRSTFDALFAAQKAYNSNLTADPFNNTFSESPVQQLNFKLFNQYELLLRLFRKVYAYNLAAYNYAANQVPKTIPKYYKFVLASEVAQFNQAVGLVNKLYNVNRNYSLDCIFFLPFPPFCNDT